MTVRSEWFCSNEILATFDEEFDLKELEDFFVDVFNLFIEDDKGQTLVEILTRDWQLFTEKADAFRILQEAAVLFNSVLYPDTRVCYSNEAMVAVNSWTDIKTELQNNRRFLMDDFIRMKDKNWEWIFSNNSLLHAGKRFYRGRINTNRDCPYTDEKDMTAPPVDKATSGRANPYGIPHLYLTDSEETAIYELRAVTGDQLTIAEFEVLEDIDIIDFTKHEDLYGMYNGDYDSLLQAVQRWALLKEVSKDMSKPVRRYDNANLDYLPTQLVSEYIRVVKGMGGLIFQSSRKGDGRKNIVIFDKNKARMLNTKLRTVGDITMQFE